MHSTEIVDTLPPNRPYLEIVQRDTGERRWFAGAPAGHVLFARVLDLLWGGPDEVEVVGWTAADESGQRGGPATSWTIDTVSPTLGQRTYEVRLHDVEQNPATMARHGLDAHGFDPDVEPKTLTHLLWRAFLTVAEDVDVRVPDDAPFRVSLECEVIGPWAPPTARWDLVERAASPFIITFRWHLDPTPGDDASQDGLIDFVRTAFAEVVEYYPASLRHNVPATDRAGERLSAFRSGLERLSDEGWPVIDEGVEWPHVLNDDPGLTIELDVTLELAADDDYPDVGADGEPVDEDLEFETEGDFITVAPLDRETLARVEALMVAGRSPDEALRSVTGTTALPGTG